MFLEVHVQQATFSPAQKVPIKLRFLVVQFGAQMKTTRPESTTSTQVRATLAFKMLPAQRPLLLVDAYCKGVKNDIYCGSVLVPTASLQPNIPHEQWYPLSSGGQVLLRLTCVSL